MLAPIVTVVSPLGAELEGLLERVEQAFGDQRGARVGREVADEHDELVAAEAAERVDLPHHAMQPRGDRLQQLVADRVAERVVDRLEVVEVDEQRRHRGLLARGAREHLLDAVDDQRPVRKVGERDRASP